MVVRIGSTALVVAIVTLATGCLTGLGLPPPQGGGGQSGSNQIPAAARRRAAEEARPTAARAHSTAAPDPAAGAGDDALPGLNAFTRSAGCTAGLIHDGTKWLAGDFDDDGRTDLAAVFNDLGSASIDVWLSTGSTFVRQRWATQQGAFWDTQKWFAGDFDGDGHADLANVFNDLNQISIDVHLSTRNGFTQQRWATRQGDFWDAQKWVAGDFDGDRYTDLANVFNDSGQTSIDLHRSTGSAFKFQRWMTRKIPFSDTQKWLFGGLGVGDPGTAFLTVFDDQGRHLDRHVLAQRNHAGPRSAGPADRSLLRVAKMALGALGRQARTWRTSSTTTARRRSTSSPTRRSSALGHPAGRLLGRAAVARRRLRR